MNPGQYDLVLRRGDTEKRRFRLWKDDTKTTPVELTGATVESELRSTLRVPQIVALDCTVTAPNIVDLELPMDSWMYVPDMGVWDLQVTFPDGTVATYVSGNVVVTGDVTDTDLTKAGAIG